MFRSTELWSRCVFALVVSAAANAYADGSGAWGLQRITHGDSPGMTNYPAVRVDSVDTTTGEVQVTACCSLDPLPSCPLSVTYKLGWKFLGDPGLIHGGDDIVFVLHDDRIAGGCPAGDPFPYMVAGGSDGYPQSIVAGLTNDITVGGGQRFSPPGAGGIANPITIHVKDFSGFTQPSDGYFHINIDQMWGLQYELVWVYGAAPRGADAGADAGAAADAGADGGVDINSARPPQVGCSAAAHEARPSLAGLALLALAFFASATRRRARR